MDALIDLHAMSATFYEALGPTESTRAFVHYPANAKRPARLVLIETRELAWHRAQYRAEHCLCAPADPVLVSLRTLQFWMWQRLQASLAVDRA